MKFAIIQFGGSNCDYDVHYVLNNVVGVQADLIWYKEKLANYDAVIIPGGFSYGDYLRAGAIAARTPIMQEVKQMAAQGKLVLGICNGFQVLTESKLLEGALMLNRYPKFVCTQTQLRIENNNTPFTSKFKEGELIKIPIAHIQGNYYADESTLTRLEYNLQAALRYVDQKGKTTDTANPNGSKENIAGILNQNKNVLGLMPHPERASEQILGSSDGIKIFKSMVEHVQAQAE